MIPGRPKPGARAHFFLPMQADYGMIELPCCTGYHSHLLAAAWVGYRLRRPLQPEEATGAFRQTGELSPQPDREGKAECQPEST